jgi:hypothetical protein
VLRTKLSPKKSYGTESYPSNRANRFNLGHDAAKAASERPVSFSPQQQSKASLIYVNVGMQ